MSATIDQAFIKQFEAEVHMAYQRMGTKLKNMVRNVNGVKGSTVQFQKVAKVLLQLKQDTLKLSL